MFWTPLDVSLKPEALGLPQSPICSAKTSLSAVLVGAHCSVIKSMGVVRTEVQPTVNSNHDLRRDGAFMC